MLAVTVLVAAGCGATRQFDDAGIQFQYPGDWSVHGDMPINFSGASVVAILGTTEWGPCAEGDVNCHYQRPLEAGEIELELRTWTLMPADVCIMGRDRHDLRELAEGIVVADTGLARVGGRPAIETRFESGPADFYRSDESIRWVIAFARTVGRAYVIEAKYRGPGVEDHRAAVDRLVGSIRLDPAFPNDGSEFQGPRDCGPPFPSP